MKVLSIVFAVLCVVVAVQAGCFNKKTTTEESTEGTTEIDEATKDGAETVVKTESPSASTNADASLKKGTQ